MNRAAGAALFALLAFAANSVLCRMALRQTHIDPASFTGIRLVAGAVTLWILVQVSRKHRAAGGGNWPSAFALLAYAIAFSFAYVGLTTGTGALLLFGAVQIVMIAAGFFGGGQNYRTPVLGWLLAVRGPILLLLPGISAPPAPQAPFMLIAGRALACHFLPRT